MEIDLVRTAEIQKMQRDLAAWLSVCPDLKTATDDTVGQLTWLDGICSAYIYMAIPGGALSLFSSDGDVRNYGDLELLKSGSVPAKLSMKDDPTYLSGAALSDLDDSIGATPVPVSDASKAHRSVAFLPLKYGTEVEALLIAESYQHDEFPEYLRDTLETVAVFISASIARIQTEHALQKSEKRYRTLAAHLEEAVTSRTVDLKKINDKLKESETRLKQSHLLARMGSWEWDVIKRKFWMSDELYLIFGVDHETDLNLDIRDSIKGLVHPDDADMIENQLDKIVGGETGEAFSFRAIRPDKEVRWIHATMPAVVRTGPGGKAEIIVGAMQDITDQKTAQAQTQRLEAELRQAQKMQAIGTLAGGIAHDFNNILFCAMGFTEMAIKQSNDENKVIACLDQVIQAHVRAADLVKQILMFSRQSEYEMKPVRLQPIIKEALKLIRSSLPSTVEIKQSINGNDTVMAEPTQIHQIVMNLCSNAAFAMRDEGGVLTVKLDNAIINDEHTAASVELPQGKYFRINVSDTGCGMDTETQKRIFDPYFTTKKAGEGTGLGLATVHGIIRDHNGIIHVYSEKGKGSVFRVFLPLCDDVETKISYQAKPAVLGSEKIMYVDDEVPITMFAKMALEELGYKVSIFNNSKEALKEFEKDPYNYDVVVTDQTMPGMTGGELSKKMLKIRPDLPIILCTGFSETLNIEKAKAIGVREYVTKPILTRDLAEAIHGVLSVD